ncbi:dnaJ homolog subfamily C member 22 [Ceratina calcarata]|uniref:DnaJ homolog subfamily C member 22 n=1 Tax=Ceratina calcarata TaxID=156304 RepID=A0AAJ7S8D5_9HYME|nr:dnaJ homolog subfamily C member 22 [Ceratina calcarata]XP_026673242.1 dnaJ homolog subfamily C member 22 [Ceratina calcarata]XP_026673243.1 dnaJ homolog subfamily C member 22 [Ceratina calcarata]
MEQVKMVADNGHVDGQKENTRKRKSKLWAYVLWLFGGLFGAHHVYLERDLQALAYFSTFGGYFGLGWLRDIYRIPCYVRDANDDPNFLNEFKKNVKLYRKPPFSAVRFAAQNAVAYMWAEIFRNAVPEDELFGINFRHLLILTPLVIALGVWTVGNIGREQGSIWITLCTAYLFYPMLTYIGDDTVWIFVMVVSASLSFDTFSKEWRLKPRKKRSFIKRMLHLSVAAMISMSLLGSYLYFNAVITDSEGEEIKLSEAIQHFLTSPIWLDLQASLKATWDQAVHQGFWATWAQLVDLTDPRGEINAYKVLGLSQTATQSDVTSRWRALSRDNHPDKIKGSEEERRRAQEKFMEIQQAYEILSKAKIRRQRRNRKSDESFESN